MGALKLNTKVNINLNIDTFGEWPEGLRAGTEGWSPADCDWIRTSWFLSISPRDGSCSCYGIRPGVRSSYQHRLILRVQHRYMYMACVLLLRLSYSWHQPSEPSRVSATFLSGVCRSLSPLCSPRLSYLLHRIVASASRQVATSWHSSYRHSHYTEPCPFSLHSPKFPIA